MAWFWRLLEWLRDLLRWRTSPPVPAPTPTLTCIDFSTMTPVAPGQPGTSPNPWLLPPPAGNVTFTTFNPAGSATPGQAAHNRLWQQGAPPASFTGLDCNFTLEVDLPTAASTVTLQLVHFSQPAEIEALDSGGAVVDKASQAPPPRVASTVTLSGAGIEKIVVHSPADEVILIEFCYS